MLTIIGAVNIDIVATTNIDYRTKDSNPARVGISVGGVAMNYARNLRLLGEDVLFITVFADDTLGQMARQECEHWGLDLSLSVTIPHSRANLFVGINNPNGDLESAACDAELVEQHLTPAFLDERIDAINTSSLVLFDTNLPVSALTYILDHCSAPMMLDTVSTAKTERFIESWRQAKVPHLHSLKVNRQEYAIIEQTNLRMGKSIENIYVTLGQEGVSYLHNEEYEQFPALSVENVVSTLGAGDAFLSGLAYSFLHDIPHPQNIAFGQRLAAATLAVEGTINPQLKEILA